MQSAKPHAQSGMISEINISHWWGVFFEGTSFTSDIYRPEWIFSKCTFHHIPFMNIRNIWIDVSKTMELGRKQIFDRSSACILILKSILMINASYHRIQKMLSRVRSRMR